MINVLVVEDDKSMQMLIKEKLKNKYNILCASDGIEALSAVNNNSIDLILCDIMMPRMNGLSFLHELREDGYDIPVIMATAKTELDFKREGFSSGADDYVTKPIVFEELIMRINALLRRSKINKEEKIVFGDFSLNSSSYEALYKDEVIELAKKEFQLLFKLLSYPGKAFSKNTLMEDIWGMDSPSDDTTIRTHINRLRQKTEHINEFEIQTIRGLGYKAKIFK